MKITSLYIFILFLCCIPCIQAIKETDSPSSWKEVGTKWGATHTTSTIKRSSDTGVKKIHAKSFAESETLYGLLELERVIAFKNLTCYGAARLSVCVVKGVTTMYGTLHAFGCSFKDLDVRGAEKNENQETTLIMDNCTVLNIFLEGRLEATKSKISSLKVIGNDLICVDSTITDITVLPNSNSKSKKAVIELTDTHIEGSITFAQKGGIVICNGTSTVKGGVYGGTIEKR